MSSSEIEQKPWSLDLMDRKGIAKFLSKYLDSNEKVKVLNINSPWGGGKTFFLTNWRAEQASIRACVYFNAWESDFTGDPFIALVASIREQLSEVIGSLQTADNVVKRFTQKASKTLIAATPALAKGVIKKFTGVDVGIVSDIMDKEALADAAEKAVEKLIETNKDTINIVKDFKSVLSELINLASNTIAAGGEVKPVYFFIDELDRCRPTFAIELLERIKHLFDVENCKFIVATDTAQLTHSIRAVYGEGFSSDKYLKRFFDVELTLNSGDIDSWVKSSLTVDPVGLVVLGNAKVVDHQHYYNDRRPVHPSSNDILAGKCELDDSQVIFVALAKTFKSKLRELEKIALQIDAVRANAMTTEFHYFWAAYLVFLKDEAPDIFEMAIHGDFDQATRELKSKYPAKSLYFIFSSISIHEIFYHYLSLYRNGLDYANNLVRQMQGSEYGYVQKANIDFSNRASYKSLSKYPVLVELAHSLD
ncbi:P-loop NTPase fold protein [Pseudomonas sp.]|uniref:KAP family P-loop NTPase fold protein n=1 Tax=Pseudomonas sp. TaxID=306 RepID=UPI0031CFCB94